MGPRGTGAEVGGLDHGVPDDADPAGVSEDTGEGQIICELTLALLLTACVLPLTLPLCGCGVLICEVRVLDCMASEGPSSMHML